MVSHPSIQRLPHNLREKPGGSESGEPARGFRAWKKKERKTIPILMKYGVRGWHPPQSPAEKKRKRKAMAQVSAVSELYLAKRKIIKGTQCILQASRKKT